MTKEQEAIRELKENGFTVIKKTGQKEVMKCNQTKS